MAQSYTRQSTFADGDTISASLFNNEYNQLLNSFAYSSTSEVNTGHRHDGTAGQGGNIFKIGDLDFLNKIEVDGTNNRLGFYVEVSSAAVEQIRIQDGAIVPVTDNDIDLGTSSLEFKDLFLDGTAHVDTLDVDANATVAGTLGVTGVTTLSDNLSVGGNLTVTGNATIAGNLTFGDAATDTVAFSADVASNLLPSADNTYDLGASGSEWKDLYIDGTANIDSLVADTADINGGTIDAADVTVGSGKTLDVSAGTLTLADNQISGDKVEGGTIAATTIADLTFGSLNDGSITVTAFVDEDNMASDSATLVPTQQSVKAYVDAQVTAQDFDFSADSGGSLSIDLDSEAMTFTGGTGIDTSGSGNAVTFAIDSTVATLTGSQTLTNKTLTTPVVSGNLTTDGLVDGRDVATDGSKLDGIEASADVTDTTNVTAAGALMDSEVTNLAQVKAFNSSDYATAAQGTTADAALPRTGGAMTGAITTNSTFDGRDVATDGTKLDGIEASADVTDAANVTAAGALMDSELTAIASVKALNQGVATTDSPAFTNLTLNGTGSVKVPAGTTAQRDGSPAAGMFRYNSSLAQFEGYTDAWGAIGGGGTNTFTTDSFTGNGSTTAYALSQTVSSEDNLLVFIEGVFQQQDAYSIATSSGTTTLTFSSAPANGNSILIYSVAAGVSGSNLNIDSMTGDGSDTTLTLSINPVNENNTQVFIDGVYQSKSNYSISGTTLTFSTAPPTGSAVEVMTMTQTDINVPVDGTITSAKLSGDLTLPGDLSFADNNKAIFGAGSDLQIYHDGSNSYVTDSGTGNLVIGADTFTYIGNPAGTITAARFNAGGAQVFNHNNSQKLATTSTGIDVTGGVTTNANSYLNGLRVGGADTGNTIYQPTGNLSISSASGTIFLKPSGTSVLTATSTGIGIGAGSPDYLLHLEKAGGVMAQLKATDSNQAYMKFVNSTTGDGTFTDGLLFGVDTDESAILWNYEATATRFATSGTERLRIDSSGLVGIGTSSPSTALHVDSGNTNNVATFESSDANAKVIIKDNTTTNFITANAGRMVLSADSTNAVASSFMAFEVDGSEAMRIDSSGNLLVGTTATGSGDQSGVAIAGGASSSDIYIRHANGTSSGAVYASFIYNTSEIGKISQNGTSQVLYQVSSDQRLKSNIADAAEDAGELIDAIQVRSFDWKADGEHQRFGMIAQELQNVAPEAVGDVSDPDEMLGVDYSKLVPMLVKEIQSLRARVAQLENN
jgi:hypothetical protein